MCRLLGYLGQPIALERLLLEPEHSLLVQSYQPREMTSGLLNADGFGIGWYRDRPQTAPFLYKSLLPAWNDINLPELGRYVESSCLLANVRSATAGQAVDLSNCQPFRSDNLLFVHNGAIAQFRQSLYRPIRDRLSDSIYQSIQGNTDSEHLFALLLQHQSEFPDHPLDKLLQQTLLTLTNLAEDREVSLSANIILSDGQQLVAARYAFGTSVPSLYWLKDPNAFPAAIVIASEPLFPADWVAFPESSILTVGADLEPRLYAF